MRVSLSAAGLVVLKASAAGSPAVELRGAAHAGDRPQPNAVVWLEAPHAPPGREARRPVLDQRNLSRAMAGERIRIPGGLIAQIAAGHQRGQQVQHDRTAFDFALTYSLRRDVDSHRP